MLAAGPGHALPVAIPGVNRGARENSESDEASDFEHMTHEEICDRAKDERDAMQLEQDETFDRAYAAIPNNNEVAKNVFPARKQTFMHKLLHLEESDDDDDEVDDSILSRPIDQVSPSSSSSLSSSSSSVFSPLGAGHLPYYED